MPRSRWISLALGAALVAPALGQSPTPPSKSPVPPQFQGQPVKPAVHYGQPTAGAASATNFKPVVQQTSNNQPAPAAAPNLLPATTLPPVEPPAMSPISPTPQSPSVAVEKRCPETVNFGAPLAYEIVVRNSSGVPVQNVRVEDELPANTRFVGSQPAVESAGDKLTWTLGTLEAGAERKIKVEVLPGAEGDFRANAMVTFSTVAAAKTRVVRPKLEVNVTGPDQAIAGDPANFNIVVSNPGSGSLTNLMLRVKLSAGLQHPNGTHIEADLGTLNAGESRTVPLRTVAATGGAQSAEVFATGDAVPEASGRVQSMVLQPQLQMRRSGPTKVMFKGEVNEEIEVANPGTAPAGNVTVTHILPIGFDFVAASDGARYDSATRAITWRLGSQPAGTRRVIGVKTKANAVGEQPLRLTATADRGLEAKAEGMLAVEGIPAISLEVVDLEDPVEVGGDLTYEIRIVNQGSCPCTNVQIRAAVPEGLVVTGCAGPGEHRLEGSELVFDPLARLATKADVVFRVRVKGTAPGDYRFKVQMTCDQLKLPVNKEEASRVYQN